MQIVETGVLPGSEIFYTTTPREISKLYYCMPCCGYFFCDSNLYVDREKHFDCLMCYIFNGSLTIGNGDHMYTAKAGDVALLDCSIPHKYYCGNGAEFVFLHYSGNNSVELTRHLVKRNGGNVFSVPMAEKIKEVSMNLIARLKNMQPVGDEEYSLSVYTVLCYLTYSDSRGDVYDGYISRAVKYIDENVTQKITLDDIAEAVHISKYYLSRLFKQEMGMPPMAYVSTTKLNAAKTLLKTTKLSVVDIAYKLGYTSSASFINIFTQHVGMSPSQFRIFPI